jgi:hypothetical protein
VISEKDLQGKIFTAEDNTSLNKLEEVPESVEVYFMKIIFQEIMDSFVFANFKIPNFLD